MIFAVSLPYAPVGPYIKNAVLQKYNRNYLHLAALERYRQKTLNIKEHTLEIRKNAIGHITREQHGPGCLVLFPKDT